jgi:hypothetical protein
MILSFMTIIYVQLESWACYVALLLGFCYLLGKLSDLMDV